MTVSAANPVGKWLDWSVQRGGDQTKTRINPAAETRIHAQFARQKPEPRHSGPEKLDRRAKCRKNDKDCVLLGECRFHIRENPDGDGAEICQERGKTFILPQFATIGMKLPKQSR